MENQKLYVVVRADLPPGARAAQLTHAALAYSFKHPAEAHSWFWDSNNLVLLETDNEPTLRALVDKARAAKIHYAIFQEPDFDMQATAAAFSSDARRLLSSLPLAFREPKKTAA